MTRNDIIKLFPEATEEQLKPLLDLNSADIGKALDKQKADVEGLQRQLTEAQATISKLQSASNDVETMRAELDKYRADEAKRTEAAKAAEVEAAIEARFKAVSEKTNFVNEYTRAGVYQQFKAALADSANAGKGDAELFTGLIQNKPGIVANPNPGINIAGPGSIDNGVLTTEAFKAMPLVEKMKWANANPEGYAKMSELLKTENK